MQQQLLEYFYLSYSKNNMTNDEQDDLIKMVNDTLKDIEEVLRYVDNNKYKAECKPVNVADCEHKLKFQKAAIKEVTESLLFLSWTH